MASLPNWAQSQAWSETCQLVNPSCLFFTLFILLSLSLCLVQLSLPRLPEAVKKTVSTASLLLVKFSQVLGASISYAPDVLQKQDYTEDSKPRQKLHFLLLFYSFTLKSLSRTASAFLSTQVLNFFISSCVRIFFGKINSYELPPAWI